jgi:hypothetical protein
VFVQVPHPVAGRQALHHGQVTSMGIIFRASGSLFCVQSSYLLAPHESCNINISSLVVDCIPFVVARHMLYGSGDLCANY